MPCGPLLISCICLPIEALIQYSIDFNVLSTKKFTQQPIKEKKQNSNKDKKLKWHNSKDFNVWYQYAAVLVQ